MSGAAWLERLALSDWFSGLEPQPGELGEANGLVPACCLPISTDAMLQIEIAVRHITMLSAPVAAVAVPDGAGPADVEVALSLVAALRSRKDARGCRMAVIVTLEAQTAEEDALELRLLERGAFVVRPGLNAGGDHFHHFPLRASVYPRDGRLVCVDLADYLASWRPGGVARIDVIPTALKQARDVLDRLPPASVASGLNLDVHPDLGGSGNALTALDQLASVCIERFPLAADNFVFTSSNRLDGKTGTADLVVIEH